MSEQLPTAHVAGILAGYGVEVSEVDEAVIAAALEQFGGPIRSLLDADLDGVEHETRFDPSRPPA